MLGGIAGRLVRMDENYAIGIRLGLHDRFELEIPKRFEPRLAIAHIKRKRADFAGRLNPQCAVFRSKRIGVEIGPPALRILAVNGICRSSARTGLAIARKIHNDTPPTRCIARFARMSKQSHRSVEIAVAARRPQEPHRGSDGIFGAGRIS